MKNLFAFVLICSLATPVLAEQMGSGTENKNCCNKEGGGCKNADGSAKPICPTSLGMQRTSNAKAAGKTQSKRAAKGKRGSRT